jgi:hypothetical protein
MAFLRRGFGLATPKGDPLHLASAALRVARHQVQLPIDDTKKGQIEGVLFSMLDDVGVYTSKVTGTMDYSSASGESGEATARWQAWLPLRAA